MTINPAALLPSSRMMPVPISNHAPAAVADLEQPAHVQPLQNVVKVLILSTVLLPLPSDRHHLSCDDCLEDKREDYQKCSALYCV